MSSLTKRQKIIQDKRKQTPWRQFVKEIASWKVVSFYKRDSCVSKYPDTTRVKHVNKPLEYENIRDSLTSYGLSYNDQAGFFEQFGQLFSSVELPSVIHFGSVEQCDYADVVANSQNCYLSFWPINDCEYVAYSEQVKDRSSYVFNSIMVRDQSEHVYLSKAIIKSFKIFYSQYVYNSSELWFCSDMIGCHDCLFCSGMDNARYCIHNRAYEKEAYQKEKERLLAQKDEFDHWHQQLKGQGLSFGSDMCEGTHVLESQNISNGKMVYQVRKGRNLFLVGGAVEMEEIYDNISVGPGPGEHMYAVVGAGNTTSHVYCSCHIASNCSSIYYSYFLDNCSYCFGCVGLKNKSYCILNKEYDKENWEKTVSLIFSQMHKTGTLGSFFPPSINPFYFNDTAAALIEDFDKEEIVNEGYLWRSEANKVDIPTGIEVVNSDKLRKLEGRLVDGEFCSSEQSNKVQNGSLRTIRPEVLQKVICDSEGDIYRIIPMEYKFLKKHGLPLPRKHWLKRLKGQFRG